MSRAPVKRPVPSVAPPGKPLAEKGQTQKYLLRLMLVDDQLRQKVRAEGAPSLFLEDSFRGLAEYLLAAEDEDGHLPNNLIGDSLDVQQQALLSGLVFQEDQAWADNPEKIFEDCRQAVARTLLRQRLQEIHRLEDEARENNDEEALLNCLRERIEINKKLKKKL